MDYIFKLTHNKSNGIDNLKLDNNYDNNTKVDNLYDNNTKVDNLYENITETNNYSSAMSFEKTLNYQINNLTGLSTADFLKLMQDK